MGLIRFSRRTAKRDAGGFDQLSAKNADVLIERVTNEKLLITIVTADQKVVTVDLLSRRPIAANIINEGFEKTGEPNCFVGYSEVEPLSALRKVLGPRLTYFNVTSGMAHSWPAALFMCSIASAAVSFFFLSFFINIPVKIALMISGGIIGFVLLVSLALWHRSRSEFEDRSGR